MLKNINWYMMFEMLKCVFSSNKLLDVSYIFLIVVIVWVYFM